MIKRDLTELLNSELDKIERLVSNFLDFNFDDIYGLWHFQKEILDFQLNTQEELRLSGILRKEINNLISTEVKNKNTDYILKIKELQENLKYLKQKDAIYDRAFALCRRLGDAFAWVLFKGEEQMITPLSVNSEIKPQRNDGLSGLLVISKSFIDAGAGFPLLHDITNILRVGDITLFSIIGEPVTFEVKSHIEKRDALGAEYLISTHALTSKERWSDIHSRFNIAFQGNESLINSYTTLPNKKNTGLLRQLDRMKKVKTYQTAKLNEVFQLENKNNIFVRLESETSHNWDIVKDIAKKAKRDGFAYKVVEGAFVYLAIYKDKPIITPFNETDSFNSEYSSLIASTVLDRDFWEQSHPQGNKLVVYPVQGFIDVTAQPHILPFYLHPIPKEYIIDILRGRLIYFVFVNLTKVTDRLKEYGYNIEVPESETAFHQEPITILFSDEPSDDMRLIAKMGGLGFYLQKIADEFLSLESFITIVSRLISTTKEQYLNDSTKKEDLS